MTRRLLKVGVSLALLGYVLRFVDVAETFSVLARADGGLFAAAFVLYLAGQALSAIKWRVLAVAVGFRASRRRFLSYYFTAMFFNAFGLGTVGGDVMRSLYLAGSGGRRTLAANTVVADRVSGLLVLLGIALISLLLFRSYDLPAGIYWTSLALSGSLLAAWRFAPKILPQLLPQGSWPRRLLEVDLAPYWNDRILWFEVGLLSLAFHLSQIVILVLLARALELSIPGSYFLIFGPLVNIFSALPISWNGLGVREGGYVFFLDHVGIGREAAVAFGLLWLVMVILGGAVGGAVYVWMRAPGRESEATEST